MPTPGKPGAGSAILAYLALLLGMVTIGLPAQQQGVVAGLWITEAIAIALPALFVLGFAGIRLGPYLGLRRITWKHALVAVGAALANQPVVSFLTFIAHGALPRTWVDEFDAKQRMLDAVFRLHAIPMLITVAVAAPLGEEAFFRGFAFPALSRNVRPVAAMAISGMLFSFLHLDWVGFLGLMEIGILLAALRWWSGSLWPAIIAHAVNNGVAGTAFLLGWEDPDQPPPAWVLVLGASLLVAGAALAVRTLRGSPSLDAEEVPGGPGRRLAMALGVLWVCALIWGVRILFALRSGAS
jgi:CAAX protease family protein